MAGEAGAIRYLSVGTLKELLAPIADSLTAVCNDVNNLALFEGDPTDGRLVFVVNFFTEELEDFRDQSQN